MTEQQQCPVLGCDDSHEPQPLPAWDEAQYQRNQRDLDAAEAYENERMGSRGYWR